MRSNDVRQVRWCSLAATATPPCSPMLLPLPHPVKEASLTEHSSITDRVCKTQDGSHCFKMLSSLGSTVTAPVKETSQRVVHVYY